MTHRQAVAACIRKWRSEHDNRRCPPKVRAYIEKQVRELKPPSPSGLAALSPDRRREISAMGGRAAQAKGTGHRFTAGSEEAREAGRKGASTIHAEGKAYSWTSEEARAAALLRSGAEIVDGPLEGG